MELALNEVSEVTTACGSTQQLNTVTKSLEDLSINVNMDIIDNMNDKNDLNDKNDKIEGLVPQDIKVIAPKNILITKKDIEDNLITLFEGLSSKIKVQLEAEYGSDVTIYYQQLYTTVTGEESYDEALANSNNFQNKCYTRESFDQFLADIAPDQTFDYITYSHKDLNKQRNNNKLKANKISKNKVDSNVKLIQEVQPNFALYLFTSISQLSNGEFSIKGLSDLQISTAKQVLETEDYYINEYVLQDGDSPYIKQQTEVILFIVGSPAANDHYMSSKVSNLRWITQTETGEPIKGLIKNNINPQTGVQVYMLRLNVTDKRQKDVLLHCGYDATK